MIITAISDMHTGHRTGLLPHWLFDDPDRPGGVRETQRQMLDQYRAWITELPRPDIVVVCGDAVDGRGERSGSTELATVDVSEQCRAAAELIGYWRPKKGIVMAYGTPYHTGTQGDSEDAVAQLLGATIQSHPQIDVDGYVIDVKHAVGGSSIPHGRATAVLREDMWNALWAEEGALARADLILRGHVHYHQYAGRPGRLCMTLPALAWGSKFGQRQCSGVIHFGVMQFKIEKGELKSWQAKTTVLKSFVQAPLTF